MILKLNFNGALFNIISPFYLFLLPEMGVIGSFMMRASALKSGGEA